MGAVQLQGGGARIHDQLAVGESVLPTGRADAAAEAAHRVIKPFRIEDRLPIIVKTVIGGLHLGVHFLQMNAQRIEFPLVFRQRTAETVGTPVGPSPGGGQTFIAAATDPATGVGPFSGDGFRNACDGDLG